MTKKTISLDTYVLAKASLVSEFDFNMYSYDESDDEEVRNVLKVMLDSEGITVESAKITVIGPKP